MNMMEEKELDTNLNPDIAYGAANCDAAVGTAQAEAILQPNPKKARRNPPSRSNWQLHRPK